MKTINIKFVDTSADQLTQYQTLVLYYVIGYVIAEASHAVAPVVKISKCSSDHYARRKKKAIVVRFEGVKKVWIEWCLMKFAFKEDTQIFSPVKEEEKDLYCTLYIHPREIERKPEVVQSISFPQVQ